MFETLFGAEMPLPVRFFIAFLIVLALIGVTAWIVRRFGAQRLGDTPRGRQPRLAVIDAAPVDGRRRLILIRRDNVEHLLMIGGPTDVVVEANIVRAAAVAREAPARAPAATDPLPRAVPLGDNGLWPLQPEPAPAPRPQRAPIPDEPMQWAAEPELPAPPAPRRQPQPRPVDPLAGLAAELSRAPELPRTPIPTDLGGGGTYTPAPREPARPQREPPVRQPREPLRQRAAVREPVREPEPQFEPEPQPDREPEPQFEPEPVRERDPPRMRETQPSPPVTDPEFNSTADQNLAEMAQRLEAALRRPARGNEARPAEGAPRTPALEPPPEPPAMPAPVRATPAATEVSTPRAEPKPSKSLYDSLEKEMASLLGRPSGKP